MRVILTICGANWQGRRQRVGQTETDTFYVSIILISFSQIGRYLELYFSSGFYIMGLTMSKPSPHALDTAFAELQKWRHIGRDFKFKAYETPFRSSNRNFWIQRSQNCLK